jgi:hypothetical protein
MIAQHAPGRVALVARLHEGGLGVGADHEPLLLASMSVLEEPRNGRVLRL